ncbi:MAG: hypothetical protein Q6K70_07330 [Thermostichales cyanobacterium DRC_bins_46]
MGFASLIMAFGIPARLEQPLLLMAVADFTSLIPAAWGTLEHITTSFLVQTGLDRDWGWC